MLEANRAILASVLFSGQILPTLQKLFRAHPEGLTIDEIIEGYRVPLTASRFDSATGRYITVTTDWAVEPRYRRPKHIKGYLQQAIDLGMMRAEASPKGFRYHASESFFSLVEDRSGQLVYAYDPDSRASRDEQARARDRELETQYWDEHRAEKQRQEEAFRRAWAAGAEERARQAKAREQEAAAQRLANTARIVGGQIQCPQCSKTFPAQGEALRDVRSDSFGDRHAVVYGVSMAVDRQGDSSWGVCKPDGCGRSFYLPQGLGGCEECGRWQDIPMGHRHGICQCGAFVRAWQRLLPPADQ